MLCCVMQSENNVMCCRQFMVEADDIQLTFKYRVRNNAREIFHFKAPFVSLQENVDKKKCYS